MDDFDQELELTRQNAELMDLLEQRSQEPGAYTLEEVEKRLGLRKEPTKQ